MKNIYKTFFLLILNAAFSIYNSFSQQITFQKTFGGANTDNGQFVRQTTDGGYIIIGYSWSFGAGISDVYLIKTDASGNPSWTKNFGGTNIDNASSVQQTNDGGYIIAGASLSFGNGNADVYLIRTDANGDTLWTKIIGGAGVEAGWSIDQTADGGFAIGGEIDISAAGVADAYLIKCDSLGNPLWTKSFGGAGDDVANSIQQTTDGGYIMAGYTESFGAGNTDVYLIKTDAIGDTLWTKTFGGAFPDYGQCVQQTTDGGYIISGSTSSYGAGDYDAYLIRTNSMGDTLWTKTFGETGFDTGLFVSQTADGGFVVSGTTLSFGSTTETVYLFRIDANGNALWSKILGGTGNEGAWCVMQTTDKGYIITGGTNSFGAGDYDVYLIKTDSLGNSGCNEAAVTTILNFPATIVSSPATIVASPAATASTPATIVGSGGTVTTLCTTVGVSPAKSALGGERITITPNPFVTKCELSFSNPAKEKFLFTLYDITGRVTESVSTTNNEIILTKGSKPAGVYLFNLVNEKTGERWNGKIIVSD